MSSARSANPAYLAPVRLPILFGAPEHIAGAVMLRVVRWTVLLAAAILPACGCGWAKRPYAHDPLLRNGYGVWGDHGRARSRDTCPQCEPGPPRPPMPSQLPNLDW